MEKTLLIIDDDASLRSNLAEFFKDKEYQVFEAESAGKALEILKENEPRAILLDIMMPGMTGIELIRELKEKKPEILPRVTLMTSADDMNYLSEAVSMGVMKYVQKSDMSLDQVYKIIEGYIHTT